MRIEVQAERPCVKIDGVVYDLPQKAAKILKVLNDRRNVHVSTLAKYAHCSEKSVPPFMSLIRKILEEYPIKITRSEGIYTMVTPNDKS